MVVSMFRGLVASYAASVKARPTLTNAGTYAVLLTAADFTGQLLRGTAPSQLDVLEAGRLATYGAVWIAPVLSVWFPTLERIVATLAAYRGRPFGPSSTLALKVLLETFTLSPVMISVMFAFNGTLAGQSPREIAKKIRSDLFYAWKGATVVWGTAAVVNYGAVPLAYRVPFLSCVSYVYNVWMSGVANRPPLSELHKETTGKDTGAMGAAAAQSAVSSASSSQEE